LEGTSRGRITESPARLNVMVSNSNLTPPVARLSRGRVPAASAPSCTHLDADRFPISCLPCSIHQPHCTTTNSMRPPSPVPIAASRMPGSDTDCAHFHLSVGRQSSRCCAYSTCITKFQWCDTHHTFHYIATFWRELKCLTRTLRTPPAPHRHRRGYAWPALSAAGRR
jgi:hypothetical protein